MLTENMKKKKSIEETEMYADYEILYGAPDMWAPEIIEKFDEKWRKIQEQYST